MASEKKTQRSWIMSVLCQFKPQGGYRLHAPFWFYTLVIGIIAFYESGRTLWKLAAGMIVLSGIPSMIQKTRYNHGASIPESGWWRFFHTLMIMGAGVVLMTEGALCGWSNFSFALGALLTVVFGGVFLVTAAIYHDNNIDK